MIPVNLLETEIISNNDGSCGVGLHIQSCQGIHEAIRINRGKKQIIPYTQVYFILL